jgi:hypothetical protein
MTMKSIVMKPQAMNAAMLGMIMPDRNVPNRCTPTRARFAPVAGVDAVVMVLGGWYPVANLLGGFGDAATIGWQGAMTALAQSEDGATFTTYVGSCRR